MATITRKPAVTAPVQKVATRPVATKPAVRKIADFEVVSMDGIQLVPKAGGGRGLDEFTAKVFSMQNGQGMKISEEKYGEQGKGLASIYAGAGRRNIKLRSRVDINGQRWLFRVTEQEEADALARKAERQAATA